MPDLSEKPESQYFRGGAAYEGASLSRMVVVHD